MSRHDLTDFEWSGCNHVECFFNKLKHVRRIATRYDRLGTTFLAMVKLASLRIRSRAYEATT